MTDGRKPRDKEYYSRIGKLTAGVPRGFSLRPNRNCTTKCPKWDSCIMQEASKTYYKGKCALANSPKDMPIRMLKLMSNDPKLLKENIVELMTITEQLTRETKDPEKHLKLLDRYFKYLDIISGENKNETKKVNMIDQLRISQAKEEAIEVEEEKEEK
jgi:hypothetical protein